MLLEAKPFSGPHILDDPRCASRKCESELLHSDLGVVRQEALDVRGGGIAEGIHLAAALKDGRSAHAGADAHGDHAKARGLAALVHLMQQRGGGARACASAHPGLKRLSMHAGCANGTMPQTPRKLTPVMSLASACTQSCRSMWLHTAVLVHDESRERASAGTKRS